MIKEIIIKESVKFAFAYATNFLKKSNTKFSSNEKEIEVALNQHIQKVKNWSDEISFKDLKKAKRISENFIELDLYVYPKKIRFTVEENIQTIPLKKLFDIEEKHIAILGQPGAGKTTSMKFLCQSIFFDEEFYPNKFKYPLLIKLRDFNNPIKSKTNAGIIFEFLFSTLGLAFDISGKSNEEIISTKKKLVLNLVNDLHVLLIIDGFDELSYITHKEIVLEELQELATFFENSKLIITSRSSDFYYNLDNIHQYEICSLNEIQIELFAKKWLGDNSKARDFLDAVSKSPFADTTIRPLTIAHLCAIFDRIGKIPEKPKTVYKKVINLLLEEWDEQRNIKRLSKYGSFEIDRKFEFLSCMAYYLTVSSRKSIFSKENLINAYLNIYEDFDLDRNESKNVVQELETHTGLFIQSGYELFEFAHKSLQEYLSAEYIVKLPFLPRNKQLIQKLPNELAIAIAISSSPSQYFIELVQNRFEKNKLTFQFYQTFVTRLLLEKPDFNKNKQVGFAALQLYSFYLNENMDSNQMKLFVQDDLIDEFEKLIDEIFKRNSKGFLSKLYTQVNKLESMNGTSIITLKRIIDIDTYNELGYNYNEIPRMLNCRETFLE